MQAAGIGLPLLNLKSMAPNRAQGYPDQDQFQSLLQQRMVSRGCKGGNSSTKGIDKTVLKAQLRQARPAASSSPLAANRSKLSSGSSKFIRPETKIRQPEGIPWRFIGEKDKAQTQEQASSPTGPVNSSSRSWNANLRSRALQLTQGTPQTTVAVAQPAQIEMTPALKGLLEFLHQQPGQALKVPPDRLPEVEAFLLNAGLPPQQVENLLSSPRFQEQGLSAAAVQSAWQKAVQDTLLQTQAASGLESQATSGLQAQVSTLQTPGPLNPLQNLTSQTDYRSLWENLTLPPQALGDLRLELQQLGIPPEALTKLNEQNYPQGIPLTQVWQLIQQTPKSAAAALDPAGGNTSQASPLLLNGGQDLEKWRQLLVQAGMDPELAQVLVSGPSPTNREELHTDLLQMAPPADPPGQLEVPKPLYLPQSVRIRPIPRLQQSDAEQGESSAGNNWARKATFSPRDQLSPQAQVSAQAKASPQARISPQAQISPQARISPQAQVSAQAQEVNLPEAPDLNKFLASLIGRDPLNADFLASAEVAGGPALAVDASLTPEAQGALWSQAKTPVLTNLRPGENQAHLPLTPPEMEEPHPALNVKGETVEAAAITTQPRLAEAAAPAVQQLAQALNQQGLTPTHLQVQPQEGAPVQPVLASFPNPGEQQPDPGQGGSGDSGQWTQNFPFSAQTQEVNLAGASDLNNFLALLNAGAPLNGDLSGSAGIAGGAAPTVNALLTPEAREALWSQVQTGVLGNLRPGENQVTLTLTPPEMGKLHLTLNLKGEMVEVTAVTSHPAVADAATTGVQQLAQALNQQGLTLTQFQFQHQDEAAKGQTQFAFSQNSGDQRQAGTKGDADKWEQPTTPPRRQGAGGVDCFA